MSRCGATARAVAAVIEKSIAKGRCAPSGTRCSAARDSFDTGGDLHVAAPPAIVIWMLATAPLARSLSVQYTTARCEPASAAGICCPRLARHEVAEAQLPDAHLYFAFGVYPAFRIAPAPFSQGGFSVKGCTHSFDSIARASENGGEGGQAHALNS